MTTIRAFWRSKTKTTEQTEAETAVVELSTPTVPGRGASRSAPPFDLDIASNDPFLTYCLNSKGVIDVDKLLLDYHQTHDL